MVSCGSDRFLEALLGTACVCLLFPFNMFYFVSWAAGIPGSSQNRPRHKSAVFVSKAMRTALRRSLQREPWLPAGPRGAVIPGMGLSKFPPSAFLPALASLLCLVLAQHHSLVNSCSLGIRERGFPPSAALGLKPKPEDQLRVAWDAPSARACPESAAISRRALPGTGRFLLYFPPFPPPLFPSFYFSLLFFHFPPSHPSPSPFFLLFSFPFSFSITFLVSLFFPSLLPCFFPSYFPPLPFCFPVHCKTLSAAEGPEPLAGLERRDWRTASHLEVPPIPENSDGSEHFPQCSPAQVCAPYGERRHCRGISSVTITAVEAEGHGQSCP